MESRNYKSGAAATPPSAPASPSNGYPTEGNPATAAPATQPGPFWFYKIGEALRSIITSAGITPSDSDLTQVAKAIQSGRLISASAGGTADALTANFTPALTGFTDGQPLLIRASSANTTTTPTFSPNGLTAKTIVKGNNQPLLAGDIAGAGHWLELNYDAGLGKWVLANAAYGVSLLPGLMLSYGRAEKTDYQQLSGAVGWTALTGLSASIVISSAPVILDASAVINAYLNNSQNSCFGRLFLIGGEYGAGQQIDSSAVDGVTANSLISQINLKRRISLAQNAVYTLRVDMRSETGNDVRINAGELSQSAAMTDARCALDYAVYKA